MKEWDNKSDQISPFEVEEISGAGYICFDCKNNNFFDGEFNIFRYYYNDGYELYFDFETLVPISIQCAECGSNKIIVEYSPELYFHFDGDDKCKQLTLTSGNHLIDFNNENGFSKLLKIVGCPEGLYNNRHLNVNKFKTADFDYAPFVNKADNIDELILKIVVKNGMKQNYDGMEGIYDDGGTYKEFLINIKE